MPPDSQITTLAVVTEIDGHYQVSDQNGRNSALKEATVNPLLRGCHSLAFFAFHSVIWAARPGIDTMKGGVDGIFRFILPPGLKLVSYADDITLVVIWCVGQRIDIGV